MASVSFRYAAHAAVLAGAIACGFSGLLPAVSHAKTPGTVHCYGGFCHYINSVDEMDAMVGRRGVLKASYYDDCKRDRFNPCGLTSSGAIFRPDQPDNAASPIFPDGTILLTYNPATRLAAVLRVTSAGPYRGDRTLDVSRATAEHLGFLKQGVATLEAAVLKSPEDHEARYKKLRSYTPVPGFLGMFESFEAAHDAALQRLQLEARRIKSHPIRMSEPVAQRKRAIDSYWPRGLAIDVALSSHALLTAAHDRVPVSPELTDFGPQVVVRALDGDLPSDAEENRIARWAEPDLVEGSIFDKLWSFVESVRDRARLRRPEETALDRSEPGQG